MEKNDQQSFHLNCLLCGRKNPMSLGMKYYESNDGWVYGKFQGNALFQGYDHMLHGGVITALLDSVMTNCLYLKGVKAVTGELHARFLHPVPCHLEVSLRACILSAKKSLYCVKAELWHKDAIMAKADAKFVRLKDDNNPKNGS